MLTTWNAEFSNELVSVLYLSVAVTFIFWNEYKPSSLGEMIKSTYFKLHKILA